ncbi:DUF2304 domain-containing protein [Candidatus Woesearchaeota archaeon]|nr:DUF2304 domain-containing protein [Candidatus Woesearchaeota archaeon]
MLLGIQILGVLFALFMFYLTFLSQKRKEFTAKEYIFWVLLWICFIIITLFPNILAPFAETLNLQRTMDLIIMLGFVFVIGMIFVNYILLKKTQRRVEELVRRIAYKELKK